MNIDDPRLTAYALGELPDAGDRAEIEALVQSDPSAAAAVAEIAATAAALSAALAAEEPAGVRLHAGQRHSVLARAARGPGHFRRLAMNPRIRVAAVLAIIAVLAAYFFPARHGPAANACDVIQVADGGRLEAFDAAGRLVGPCPLEHTDVAAEISGHFSRVTVTQAFKNPYQRTIEAVYTFP